jgi:hypothetical protein
MGLCSLKISELGILELDENESIDAFKAVTFLDGNLIFCFFLCIFD